MQKFTVVGQIVNFANPATATKIYNLVTSNAYLASTSVFLVSEVTSKVTKVIGNVNTDSAISDL